MNNLLIPEKLVIPVFQQKYIKPCRIIQDSRPDSVKKVGTKCVFNAHSVNFNEINKYFYIKKNPVSKRVLVWESISSLFVILKHT